MGIITKLKSLLAGGGDSGTRVAVEREPETASEQAVKGLDEEEVDHRLPDEQGGVEDVADADTGEPVESVKGIGPAYAERLAEAGIESVEQLGTADVEALAEETGLGAGRIGEWIERAKARSR